MDLAPFVDALGGRRAVTTLITRAFRVALLRSVVSGRQSTASAAFSAIAVAMPGDITNRDLLDLCAEFQRREYRNEYFYKNALAGHLIAPRRTRAALLMELRIASSVADAVHITDHPTVYEIKTEHDDLSKLKSQIRSYEKVAPSVVIVSHDRVIDRLRGDFAPEIYEGVGLATIGRGERLRVVRPPKVNLANLDRRALFDVLRREEYVRIAWRATGRKPIAPNALLFDHCLEIAASMPLHDFAHEVFRELRTRGLQYQSELAESDLKAIRSLCVQLNPSREQLQIIRAWMEEPRGVFPVRSR